MISISSCTIPLPASNPFNLSGTGKKGQTASLKMRDRATVDRELCGVIVERNSGDLSSCALL
jgi:hypothetical protein